MKFIETITHESTNQSNIHYYLFLPNIHFIDFAFKIIKHDIEHLTNKIFNNEIIINAGLAYIDTDLSKIKVYKNKYLDDTLKALNLKDYIPDKTVDINNLFCYKLNKNNIFFSSKKIKNKKFVQVKFVSNSTKNTIFSNSIDTLGIEVVENPENIQELEYFINNVL